MVEFVHPHVFIRLLALSHAENVLLIESHIKTPDASTPSRMPTAIFGTPAVAFVVCLMIDIPSRVQKGVI